MKIYQVYVDFDSVDSEQFLPTKKEALKARMEMKYNYELENYECIVLYKIEFRTKEELCKVMKIHPQR